MIHPLDRFVLVQIGQGWHVMMVGWRVVDWPTAYWRPVMRWAHDANIGHAREAFSQWLAARSS